MNTFDIKLINTAPNARVKKAAITMTADTRPDARRMALKWAKANFGDHYELANSEKKLAVGDKVQWTDPDEGETSCSGPGFITHISGSVYHVVKDDGGEVECPVHELKRLP